MQSLRVEETTGGKTTPASRIGEGEGKRERVLYAIPTQNVHGREFKLRLGFSSYDEQVSRNWYHQ